MCPKGKTKDGTVCNGTLSIPNLSEEYCDDMDDIQVDVTLTSDDTPERRKVKDIVRKDIAVLIREQLTKWCGARFPTRVLQLPVLF